MVLPILLTIPWFYTKIPIAPTGLNQLWILLRLVMRFQLEILMWLLFLLYGYLLTILLLEFLLALPKVQAPQFLPPVRRVLLSALPLL